MKDQKGITLIEVLAGLTILLIVIYAVWNVLIQGVTYSNNVQLKTLMQQEANTIITAARNLHQTKQVYSITYDNNPDSSYVNIEASGNMNFQYNNSNFVYTLYTLIDDDFEALPTDETIEIYPNAHDFPIKLEITYIENPNVEYEIQTYLSRLR